ncbi:MAG: MFS transporter [Planctomycetaceae bacterium]
MLTLMGTQSAYFGPSKYGILPEMLRDDDLPQANGIIQMTTFLAIILGTALAGYGKELAGNGLWKIGLICVVIAIAGTLTSLFIRKTPVAKPDLQFQISSLAINKSTRSMLWNDRPLLMVLLISSLFWFIGGAVLPSVNKLGKELMHLGDGRTSLLAACMGFGIGLGCLLAGKLSRNEINFRLVRVGAWGIVVCLIVVPFFGVNVHPDTSLTDSSVETVEQNGSDTTGEATVEEAPIVVDPHLNENLWQKLIPESFWEFGARLTLTLVGLFAGLFAVPLQTFMQTRPPADQKGQMIGAMNLINWIGILLSSAFLAQVLNELQNLELSSKWCFPVLALLMVPVALFFKPPSEKLLHQVAVDHTPHEEETAETP